MELNTLVFIFYGTLTLGAAASFVSWLNFRHNLLLSFFFYLLGSVIFNLTQTRYPNPHLFGFLILTGSHFLLLLYLGLYNNVISAKLPIKNYLYLVLSGASIGVFLLLTNGNYFSASMIFCLSCCVCALHSVFNSPAGKKNRLLIWTLKLIMTAHGLHFLGLPYALLNTDLTPWIQNLSLMFPFLICLLLPTLLFQKISDENKILREKESQLRTQALQLKNTQLNENCTQLQAKVTELEAAIKENRNRLSSLVHDLSNPLQVLFHSLYLLSRNSDKFLQTLPARIERAQVAIDSIQQILVDAKSNHVLDIGKSSHLLTKQALAQIASDLCVVFEEKLKAKNITLTVDFESLEGHSLLGNIAWLKNQILANLLSNSIKFSNPGGRIHIHTGKPMGEQIPLYLSDNGVGISAQQRLHIFEMNQPTSSTGTNGETGTGLGLPIVKQYVELMGGSIHLINQETPGTCFEIRLNKRAA